MTMRAFAAMKRVAALGAAVVAFAVGDARAQNLDPAMVGAVKATYLYKISPLVEWPSEVFESDSGPFRLCVVGEDRLGQTLDEAIANQNVAGRPIVAERMTVAVSGTGCHVMLFGGSAEQTVAQGLAAVRGEPVLTVTDHEATPGMINFVISDNRVRFEIDDAAAAESRLKISSKILGLAVRVRRRA